MASNSSGQTSHLNNSSVLLATTPEFICGDDEDTSFNGDRLKPVKLHHVKSYLSRSGSFRGSLSSGESPSILATSHSNVGFPVSVTPVAAPASADVMLNNSFTDYNNESLLVSEEQQQRSLIAFSLNDGSATTDTIESEDEEGARHMNENDEDEGDVYRTVRNATDLVRSNYLSKKSGNAGPSASTATPASVANEKKPHCCPTFSQEMSNNF
jgi:hypothetical protein